MNKRNVEGLIGAIVEYVEREGYIDIGGIDATLVKHGDRGDQLDHFAEFLATRGVLVPSALTDDDTDYLVDWAARWPTFGQDRTFSYVLRGELDRIAKGEPRGPLMGGGHIAEGETK